MRNDRAVSREKKKRQLHPEHWQVIAFFLILYDFLAENGAYFLALWLRFDGKWSMIPEEYLQAWQQFVPLYSAFCLLVFCLLHLYRSVWRYASYTELSRVMIATVITSVFHCVGITLFCRRMPISYYVLGAVLQLGLVLAIRFSYRFVLLERSRSKKRQGSGEAKRVMLIGAGSAGQMILRDIHSAREIHDVVTCIIDDDSSKQGRYIEGVPVVGGRNDILANVKKYQIDKIFVALPSVSMAEKRKILEICQDSGCEVKVLPGLYQLVQGSVNVSDMKDVALEDLLGREPVSVDMEGIFRFLKDKVILVTGGGGSIGSELCCQIARHQPKLLIIFDVYENNAHAIALKIMDLYPEVAIEVLIGSVRDSKRVNQVFARYKPDIVYHAAAHKHVPLMEFSPCEAIKNNTIGTYKVAYAAMMNGCQRFVLVSTDKAVNPTNIMGASKRLCEMVIQSFDHQVKAGAGLSLPRLSVHGEDELNHIDYVESPGFQPKTEFVAVRFGNVLGSNGSVVPRFKEQIAKGGPVTVTHPDIVRYFMTIPEAVSLVLQASTYAEGGEIFVLDMGAPVKIDTLARNMIRLSGFQPDVDIPIVYTGLRPGEKLYEEKLMAEEGLRTTANQMIHIGKPIPFDIPLFLRQLQQMMEAAYNGQNETVRALVEEAVPTYHQENTKESV